ncbi:MAG: hypothetical protein HY721_24360, partial [Planctomycetes bacterium]|nr:hypothetical protein [Planctomycetota bacterium]
MRFSLSAHVTVLLAASALPSALRAEADLAFTLTLTPASPRVGDTITYELQGVNVGPDATQFASFRLTTSLAPQIFAPRSIEASGTACSLAADGRSYTCDYPRLNPGDPVRVTIVGEAIAVGTAFLSAGVALPDDSNRTNNFPSARLTVFEGPEFCQDCLVGEVACGETVQRRLDDDCRSNFRFVDIWRFEVDRPRSVSIETTLTISDGVDLTVRDAECRPVPRGPCTFRGDGTTCRFDLQAGTHSVLVGASQLKDYELRADCGGASSLACTVAPDGGSELRWTNSPLHDPAAPISIRVNGVEVASVPGRDQAAVLAPETLAGAPDGVAEVCVVDSSGLPACCALLLADDLAVNCGGPRLDEAVGTGVGDGRTWLEDTAENPSIFLVQGEGTVDFAAAPGGFTVADTRLVEPRFTDDPQRSRLFATARTRDGEIAYRFAVRPGDWEVVLLFAEGSSSGGCLAIPDPAESPGSCRVFDIALNGDPVEERFAPHVAAQRGLGNPLPNSVFGVAVARDYRARGAGQIKVSVRDLGPGDPPGDAMLEGILLRRIRPARFELEVAGPACGGVLEGPAGGRFATGLECTLATSDNPFDAGARAWSLSLAAEGAAVSLISTEGTAAAPAAAGPPGLRQGGFELSELTAGPGNEGAVSTVVLSFESPVTLPAQGTVPVARIALAGTFPPVDCRQLVTVFYADGRSGSLGPVENRVLQLDLEAEPALGRCAFELAGLPAVPFQRGDSNGDAGVDISDAILVLLSLFAAGFDLSCLDAADADDDGEITLSDAVVLLNHLFRGGPRPPEPFDRCGTDPTGDPLGCSLYDACPPPPEGGECPPPPSGGPVLVRSAPSPFAFPPLLKGLFGRARLTVRNPRSTPVTVRTVTIDPRFDDELFALEALPPLPVTLAAGEALAADLAGSSRRLGLHRVDVRYETDRNEHVEEVLFEVALGSLPEVPGELTIVTLPGQPAEGALLISNGAAAAEDLAIDLEGASASGPFSVDESLLPAAVAPGGTLRLPVRLRFDASSPGELGDQVRGELHLRSNGREGGDGRSGTLHRVRLEARISPGATFSGPLAIALGGEATRTLVAEAPFRAASFRVGTADPRSVRLRGPGGDLADEVRGLAHGAPVTFAAVGSGFAEIEVSLESTGAGGGGGLAALQEPLDVGRERATVATPVRAGRLLDGGDGGEDRLEIISLPGGDVLAAHRFPGDDILRNSDLVVTGSGGEDFGLLTLRSGRTDIYRFRDGARVASIPSGGGAGVPGVDPVVVRLTVPGDAEPSEVGISVDSRAALVSYRVTTGEVLGRVALRVFSEAVDLGAAEDVDPVVSGKEDAGIDPVLFFLGDNGECFAVSLPALGSVTRLGQIAGGARVAVDPVPLGSGDVAFPGASGEVLFAVRAAGGFRTYRYEPLVDRSGGQDVFQDALLAEVDPVPTADGRFLLLQTAQGHVRVLDREKLDPQGPRAGQPLVTLSAPFSARSVQGVDPILVGYDPAGAAPEADARVIAAYERGVVRIWSLDGGSQITLEPLAGSSGRWERNIDVLADPRRADRVHLFDGEGTIRVVDPLGGRLLHTITGAGAPIEGVDPKLSPDGSHLIAVTELGDGQATITLHGVAPGTFGVRRALVAGLPLPQRDVDLAVLGSGEVLYTDLTGTVTALDLEGTVLYTVPRSEGGGAVNGVDLSLPGDGEAQSDEDWAEPTEEEKRRGEPPVHPPEDGLPPPDPGAPDPEADPEPGNPEDTPREGGGVCPLEEVCLCEGDVFDLAARVPELRDCPPGAPSGPSSEIKEVSRQPVAPCAQRPAIRFEDHLIPLHELVVRPADACGADHYHAANGFDALALDGTRVRDPNPSSCGYGKVSEVPVVAEAFEDCSGEVLEVRGREVVGKAPGESVLHVRPCIAPGQSPEEVKPREIVVTVIRPRKLTAKLLEDPGTVVSVEKTSAGPECLAAACGDAVRLTGESCPARCVELLELGDAGGTATGPCDFIFDPLDRKISEGAAVADPDFVAPASCGVHQAVLRCKDRPHSALKPIHIHVIGIDVVLAPKVLALGSEGTF